MDLFWERCGAPESFPRALEDAVQFAFPVSVIKLPKLQLAQIETWFARRYTKYQFGCASRRIRGCLIAYGGKGFIFIDEADAPDEQRFTLSHEIGHFLIDYWIPRHKAISKFGLNITAVLDGHRKPSIEQRLHAILGSIRLGVYSELMTRTDSVESLQTEIWDAESRADRIAIALLAPPENVFEKADVSQAKYDDRIQNITRTLTEEFGLPASVAPLYGNELLTLIGKERSWSEIFR
ncbi:MAG: ImmA/IrrE family metallo-endopeptidase [Acidobacteriota bacterium]|nr:ImmA/IrrE family metallo-endopeptidase [Acidobacteriota bacterium]